MFLFTYRRIHILIAAVCLLLTVSLAYGAYIVSERRAESAYRSLVDDSRAALLMRLDSYLLALDGLSAFLGASDNVSALDWSHYVETLKIEETLPGVLGMGLILPVQGAELGALQRAARAAGEPEIVIHPETGRPDKMIVRYIAPGGANDLARGLDVAFEPKRVAAAEAARDDGQPRITGPVALVQNEQEGPGALLLRPFYDGGLIPQDVAGRRAAHAGWVYAPFFANDALAGLTAGQDHLFDVTVLDGAETIYQSDVSDATSRYVRTQTIDVFGRSWSMTWASTPAFDNLHNSFAPYFVLVAGLSATLLLWRYLRLQDRRADEIRALVDSKTRALSDRVRQNRSVIDNSVFGVVNLDEEGRIVAANPAAKAILGRGAEDLFNVPLDSLVTLDDPSRVQTGPRRATITADGKLKHLEVQANVWRRSDGTHQQSVLLRDVTEETQSRDALCQAEQRWNLALEGAEIGVFDVDLTTNTSVVSDTWRRLMDVPADVALDTQAHFFSRVHPDDIHRIVDADRAAILGHAPRSISEFRIHFDNGSWRWMRSDAVVVERSPSGRALRLIGSQTDITALRTAQQAHMHGEEMLRLVIDRAPVGTAILDLNGDITRSNAALTHMTQFEANDLAGQHFGTLICAEEQDALLSAIGTLRGEPRRTYRGEHRINCADGDVRWGLVKVSWALDPAQEMEIYIVQINDITQEKRAELVKSEFIATISHELRTPLTSIKGALGLMAAQVKAGKQAGSGRLLEIAISNTNRLIGMVNDILDLEKMTAGKLEFRVAAHTASAIVNETIEQNRPLLLKNELSFRFVDQTGGAQVLVDDARVAQVLSNLLSNACKFAPAGSPIVVHLTADDDTVRVAVTDSGPGVPAAFKDRIFLPFSQADSSDTRQKGGTGLGLNISRQMIERMGGTIGYTSEPDVRTTFFFTMPRWHAPELAVVPSAEKDARKKILHLEADSDFAEVIRYSMADLARVTSAKTLDEARARMAEQTFDLILVDWSLRDAEASCLLDELIAAQPDARIVALSSTEPASDEYRVDHAMLKSREELPDIVANLRDEMHKIVAA